MGSTQGLRQRSEMLGNVARSRHSKSGKRNQERSHAVGELVRCALGSPFVRVHTPSGRELAGEPLDRKPVGGLVSLKSRGITKPFDHSLTGALTRRVPKKELPTHTSRTARVCLVRDPCVVAPSWPPEGTGPLRGQSSGTLSETFSRPLKSTPCCGPHHAAIS